MKINIDINNALMEQAKQIAEKRKQTLESILEIALREFLERDATGKTPFKLRKSTFRGQGLHPDIKEGDWTAIKELAYKKHGG